mmetsp:Transcript_146936/g.259020  ORF Transcript_146936/g.259020 Transcript_146936/m.259020 type:complete len:641 (+) Transcript_146936:60-1982(+)
MSNVAGSFPTQLLSKLEKISIQSVNVGDLVGKGRFKRVHKGRWRGRDVVLLRYSKDTQRGFSPPKQRGVDWASDPPQASEELDKNLNELKILSSISKKENSQFVPEIYGVCHEPKSTIIVQEFAPWGMLKSNLKDPAFTAIVTNLHKLHCAAQVCRAMGFLESERIVHADLSCRNVLIFRCEEPPHSMIAKVSDFGLSAVLKEGSNCEYRRQPMPTRWCSPETVAKYKLSHKADVWSYGVTHWEIYAAGQDPWPLRSKRSDVAFRLRDLAENGAEAEGGDDVSSDFPKAEDCPDVVHRTYLSCFQAEEAARPSFAQLAETLERIIEAGGDMDSSHSPFPCSTPPAVHETMVLPRRKSIEPDSPQWKWWREKAEEDTEIAARLKVLKKFSDAERELLLEAEGRLLKQREKIEEMKKEAAGRRGNGLGGSANVPPGLPSGTIVPRSVDVMYPKYGELVDGPCTPPISNFRPDVFSRTPPFTPPPNGHTPGSRWITSQENGLPVPTGRAFFTLWSVAGGLLHQEEFASEPEARAAFHNKRNAGQPCSLRNAEGQEVASASWQALDSYWKDAFNLFPGANFFQSVQMRTTNLSPPRCMRGRPDRLGRHTIHGTSWNNNTGSSVLSNPVSLTPTLSSPPMRVMSH